MKTFQHNVSKLFAIAVACSFAVTVTVRAGPNSGAFADNARLTVWRAADFGTIIFLNLYIDGVQVTTLGRNEGYEAIVRPGHHVFSIGTSPSPYGKTNITHRPVTVERGRTYAFTALWLGANGAALENGRVNHIAGTGW